MSICRNARITINEEVYFVGSDGLLIPSKQDQPPDLRYFKRPQK
jgi:hypothetical protein